MGEIGACVVWRHTLYKFRSRVKYCEMLPNITSCHNLLCKHSLLLFYLALCNQLLLNWIKTYQEAKPPECLWMSQTLPGNFFHYQYISNVNITYITNLKVLIRLKNMIIFINFEFIGTCSSLSNKFLYDHKILLFPWAFGTITKIDCSLSVANSSSVWFFFY